jgi:hypothetical protein
MLIVIFSIANIRTFYKTSKKMQKKNKFLLFEVHSGTAPLCTFSFVITNLDEVPRLGERTPGDVEPAIARE